MSTKTRFEKEAKDNSEMACSCELIHLASNESLRGQTNHHKAL